MNGPNRLIYWLDCAISLLAVAFIATLVFGLPADKLNGVAATFGLPGGVLYTIAVILGSALLVFTLYRYCVHLVRTASGRYLVFDTAEGLVRVRAGSVEHVITRAVRCMDEVADARARLVIPKGSPVPTKVRIRCRLYDRPNILGIKDSMRALVCDRYLEMFPSEEPLPVDFQMEGTQFETPGPKVPPKPHPKRTERSGEPPEDDHPLRAQFPIND